MVSRLSLARALRTYMKCTTDRSPSLQGTNSDLDLQLLLFSSHRFPLLQRRSWPIALLGGISALAGPLLPFSAASPLWASRCCSAGSPRACRRHPGRAPAPETRFRPRGGRGRGAQEVKRMKCTERVCQPAASNLALRTTSPRKANCHVPFRTLTSGVNSASTERSVQQLSRLSRPGLAARVLWPRRWLSGPVYGTACLWQG